MIHIQSLKNSTILIVDDQSTSRNILSQVIRSISTTIKIVEKSNPESALEWATQNVADLVFVDFLMPRMNGIDFIRLIKLLPDYASVPILMITVKKDTETRYAALDAGVADFLSKPVDVYECSARCKNLLTMRQQHLTLQNRSDQLEKKVKLAIAEIRVREQETLMRLARTGEYKDYDTTMHMQRMALFSKAIAETAGFSDEDATMIELSAPLHDLGKIGIPDHILLKKGMLNADETIIMRKHPIIGYEILRNSQSKWLQMGAEIALGHHERFDGGGYPYQLKAEQIPISARIVAIADVLDALTSKRPHKEAWSMNKAFEYLEEESGKHFDPDLIALTLSIRKKIEEMTKKADIHLH
jgi:two-component system, response regulator RpfG